MECWLLYRFAPFYAYMNYLFKKMTTLREGDDSKIPSYNKNILAAMAPNGNEFFSC
jgi:hypothetical protein